MAGTSGTTIYRAPCPSANLAGVTGAQLVLNQQGGPLILPFPTNGTLDSVPFQIRIYGHYSNLQATRTVTGSLLYGTSPTLANNLGLASFTGHSFTLSNMYCLWDHFCYVTGANKVLIGYNFGLMGTLSQNLQATQNVNVVGPDPNQDSNNQSSAPLGFTLSWNATTANAAEFCFIDVFELRI